MSRGCELCFSLVLHSRSFYTYKYSLLEIKEVVFQNVSLNLFQIHPVAAMWKLKSEDPILYDEECLAHVKQALSSFPNWWSGNDIFFGKEFGAEWLFVSGPSSGFWGSVSVGNLRFSCLYAFDPGFLCVCHSRDFSSWYSLLFFCCSFVCCDELILILVFSFWILSSISCTSVQHLIKRWTSLKL